MGGGGGREQGRGGTQAGPLGRGAAGFPGALWGCLGLLGSFQLFLDRQSKLRRPACRGCSCSPPLPRQGRPRLAVWPSPNGHLRGWLPGWLAACLPGPPLPLVPKQALVKRKLSLLWLWPAGRPLPTRSCPCPSHVCFRTRRPLVRRHGDRSESRARDPAARRGVVSHAWASHPQASPPPLRRSTPPPPTHLMRRCESVGDPCSAVGLLLNDQVLQHLLKVQPAPISSCFCLAPSSALAHQSGTP